MSNIKIRFSVLKSNILTNLVILLFFTTLSFFSRSLYESMGLNIPYNYVFLVILVLTVVNLMFLLLDVIYILFSEPYRSLGEAANALEALSYVFDRLFQFTNPKEYAKAVELGMKVE